MKYKKILVIMVIMILILNGCSRSGNNLSSDKEINGETLAQESIETETEENSAGSQEELVVFKEQGKYGFKNNHGEVVIEPIYDFARDFSKGLAIVKLDQKYGYINRSAEIVIDTKFDYAKNFSDGLAVVKENNVLGYINKKGDYEIEPQFDQVEDFHEGLAIVKIDRKYGYINKQGDYEIVPQFDQAENFKEGLAIVKIDQKYGYINKGAEIVIDIKFDYAKNFNDGLAVVEENNVRGYINKKGDYEIEPQFDQAEDFQEGLAYVENQIFKGKGVINKQGEIVIEIDEEEIDSFEDGKVKIVKNGYFGFVNKEGKFVVNDRKNLVPKILDSKHRFDVWGYISKEGDLIAIEDQFQEAKEFINGIALIKKKNYYGYINLEGEFLVEGLDEAYDFKDGKGLGRKEDVWNYYDDSGNIVDSKYNDGLTKIEIGEKKGFIDEAGKIVYDKSSKLRLWEHNDKYGYLDQNTNIAISPRYSDAMEMKNGFAAIKEANQYDNGRWTYINIDGEQLLRFQFDEVNSFNASGIAIVKRRDKYGYINRKGDYVIEPIFEKIDILENGKTKCTVNDYEGFINESGELIKVNNKTLKPKLFEITYSTKSWGYIDGENRISILPKYDYAENFDENNNAFIMKDQMLGFINNQGNYVLKPQFSQIKEFSEGLAAVKKDNQWGYIDMEKNIVIDPEFDYANDFKNGKAKIIINDQYGIIDTNGNLINDIKPIEFNQNYDEVKINSTEELLELINNKIQVTEEEVADQMIKDLIKSLKENELNEYRKYKKDGELSNRKLFNHYIKDEGYYHYLDMTLYIDYKSVHENYYQYLSDELNDYLEIKYNQKEKPLFQDGALAISLDTFVERIITYETFLNSYPDSNFLEDVADPFKLMMSTLIYPNFANTRYFEGVPRSELNKQNKPKDNFIDVYKKIINHEKKAEISQNVAKKLLNTVERSENDDLSDIDLSQLREDAELEIEEKYLNNN